MGARLCKLAEAEREEKLLRSRSTKRTTLLSIAVRSRFNGAGVAAVSAEDHGSTPERYAGSPTPLREQLTLRAPRLERDSVHCGSDAREEAPGMRSTTATTPATTRKRQVSPRRHLRRRHAIAARRCSTPTKRSSTNLSFFKIILTSKCTQR